MLSSRRLSQHLGLPHSDRTAVLLLAEAHIKYLHLTSKLATPAFSQKPQPALPQPSSAATSAPYTQPPDNLLTARFSTTSTQVITCAVALPSFPSSFPCTAISLSSVRKKKKKKLWALRLVWCGLPLDLNWDRKRKGTAAFQCLVSMRWTATGCCPACVGFSS